MAKEIKAKIKLQIPGGAATPAPPVGSSLGQQGVNSMVFCKQFNAQTAGRKGETVPVEILVYTDKSFAFTVKTPPATELIKKKINLAKGSSNPKEIKVGKISWKDIEDIARIKMPDLNARTIEAAMNMVEGTCKQMGVMIEG